MEQIFDSYFYPLNKNQYIFYFSKRSFCDEKLRCKKYKITQLWKYNCSIKEVEWFNKNNNRNLTKNLIISSR